MTKGLYFVAKLWACGTPCHIEYQAFAVVDKWEKGSGFWSVHGGMCLPRDGDIEEYRKAMGLKP